MTDAKKKTAKINLDHGAYNLQYFNFTAESLYAQRTLLLQTEINKFVDYTVKQLETPKTSALLAEKKEAVVNRLQDACNKNLIRIRKLDKHIFDIPPNVLLMPDMDLQHKYTSADEQKKTEQLDKLKTKFRQNSVMLAELNAEQKRYAVIEELIQRELKIHKQIYDACASFEFTKLNKLAMNAINAKDH